MSAEWIEVSLSEVFTLDNAKLGKHSSEPRVLSLSKYDGFVPSDEYFDKRIASANLDGYKVVDPHGWAYSTIHIDEGSIARNTLGFTGVISPMYTTMRWSSDAHCAAYFAYLLKSPAMLSAYQDSAQGTVNRRRSLAFKTFSSLKVTVPPLPVQRRIVDLMTHVDSHLANLRAEREALRDVEIAQRRTFLAPNEDWDSGLLGDLAEVRLGRMLSKERSAGESLAPYIRNANVQWAGLDLRDLKQMDFPAEERVKYALRSGDILVCEGGDPGRAVLLDEDIEGVYYQKAIHRVRPSDSVDSQFLYFWLAEAYADGRINDLCTNTTIKHLTAEKFKTLAVRLPAVDVQKTIAGRLRQLQGHAASIDREIAAAISVRNALLGDLLTQEAVINAEYDLILGVVA